MNVIPTRIPDVLVLEPRVFEDRRGYFMETYHRRRYDDAGIHRTFVQDNLSFSSKGVLRGLHFQVTRPQAKLVQALTGSVFDVVVDIRRGSPTFGHWIGEILSAENRRQMFIPEGFAHGFLVLSDTAHFLYKCSDFYAPEDEAGLLWSDPDIAISWPPSDPVVSEKDRRYPRLFEFPVDRLPLWKAPEKENA